MNPLLKKGNEYYSEKLKQYGPCAKGVDWNSETSQELRFVQLLRSFPKDQLLSVCDYGCGYGALFPYFSKNNYKIVYTGYDINSDMLSEARRIYPEITDGPFWKSNLSSEDIFDFTLISGIFNLKFQNKEEIFIDYIKDTLNHVNAISRHSFAFNLLTSYSDEDKKKDYLFYADPLFWFDYCKRNFSRNVALLHDYEAYEFTIIVKK